MRNFISTTFAFSLIAATTAFAQSTSSNPPAKSATPSAKVGSAPVGHRQPTQADVGSEKNAADMSAEDKALDRKIKGICRGC